MFSTPAPTRCSSRAAVVVGGWRAPIRLPDSAALQLIRSTLVLDPVSGDVLREGCRVGYKSESGYLKFQIGGRRYLVHRVVWLLFHGDWPCFDIDHINGDRSDNRPVNLRDVPRAVNCQNKCRALVSNKTTGLLGANYHASNGKRFRAQIWFAGKNHHVGYFDTAEEAHEAYVKAKAEFHPGFVPERFI